MNVKELFENEELMNNIVEDIEDIPADSEVTYCVFALGYDAENEPTDTEILVGEFDNPDDAVACAKNITIATINETGTEQPDSNTAYFSIEVETVIADPDDEDGGTMNIGTIYSKELWIEGNFDPIVEIKTGDYALLEDGILKVNCKLLKDFNKNDCVNFKFVDENDSWPLCYKIMSKVIYEDGDYYHCDLYI